MVSSCIFFFPPLVMDSYSDLRKRFWRSVFPHPNTNVIMQSGHVRSHPGSLHVKMLTHDCLHRAGGSHGVIHSFFHGHPPCRVPVLVGLHDVVDQSKFRIIDRCNRLKVLADLFALVCRRDKWHDSTLESSLAGVPA